MKNLSLLISLVIVTSTITAQTLTPLWEVHGLEAPESVTYDSENDMYFVSNVSGQPAEKNGNGYISLIDKAGNIVDQKWLTGFHAPKGLDIYKNLLYIADIDKVYIIDIRKAKIIKSYDAAGATFLNDIEIDNDGVAYITDTFGGNAIYRIKDGNIELWLKDEALNYPNGLIINDEKLLVSSWGVVTNAETFETDIPGRIISVDLEDKSLISLTNPTGNLDGIQVYGSKYLVSDWINGGLFIINESGDKKQLLKLNAGSADFEYVKSSGTILIPQMLDGTLSAYRFN